MGKENGHSEPRLQDLTGQVCLPPLKADEEIMFTTQFQECLPFMEKHDQARMVLRNMYLSKGQNKWPSDEEVNAFILEKAETEEDKKIADKIIHGQEAIAILIERNKRLVLKQSLRYINRGLDLDDLIQEGNRGLIRAVIKFRPDKKCKLSTYAVPWIRQTMRRALAGQGRTICIPARMAQDLYTYDKICAHLYQKLQREPTDQEIAHFWQVDPDYIDELKLADRIAMSLENQLDPENPDITLLQLVQDNSSPSPEEEAQKMALREILEEVLQSLTDRERTIIKLRTGWDDGQTRTLEEIGKEIGITRERTRQIEAKVLRKIRRPEITDKLAEWS